MVASIEVNKKSIIAMETNKGVATFYAKTRKQWRAWLQKNSSKKEEVYLILHNKKSKENSSLDDLILLKCGVQ